jgi:phage recombination protein Bet
MNNTMARKPYQVPQQRDQQALDAPRREQVELIKSTLGGQFTDDELGLFLYVAKQRGLDPLLGQIHAVKRWDSNQKKKVMKIQVGIDGFRLVAERTHRYAPGQRPTFVYDDMGQVVECTAYVRKLYNLIKDGKEHQEWITVEATARFDEYVQKTKDGAVNTMWRTKPHIMLGKCAEALAHRKAFPAEMSRLYSVDELGESPPETVPPEIVTLPGGVVVDEPGPEPLHSVEAVDWDALVERAKAAGMDRTQFWQFVASTFRVPPPKDATEADEIRTSLNADGLEVLWTALNDWIAPEADKTTGPGGDQ